METVQNNSTQPENSVFKVNPRKANKSVRLIKRKKPGRGRIGADELIEILLDKAEWKSFQDQLTTHCSDNRDELEKYFNEIDEIECDMLGGALFGDDSHDPGLFETICEGLKENEKAVLIEKMYKVEILDENTFTSD